MSLQPITLRPALPSDEPFLLELRTITMSEHLERIGGPTTEEAHLQRVRHRYEDANIICSGETRLGLLKLHRGAAEWHLVQIQVLPSHQGQGLGRQVIQAVLDDARRNRLPVRLSVLHGNPARQLYERLGFRPTGEDDRETTLTWTPEA
ncbi:MAG TPA: GNAT family N-acetyltransferase [Roseomonas sp.]